MMGSNNVRKKESSPLERNEKTKFGRRTLVKDENELPYPNNVVREDRGCAFEIEDALKVLYIDAKKPLSPIVDLGCGEKIRIFNGKDKEKLEVQRCDIWDTHVENLIVSDLNNEFPYQANTFDWILAIEILEHLENPWHFFRECKRISRNEASIFLTVPFIESPRQRVRFYDTGGFGFFGDTKKLSYRDAYKHITPIFEWQLAQIFISLGMVLEHRLLIETKYSNFEILMMRIRVEKGENVKNEKSS